MFNASRLLLVSLVLMVSWVLLPTEGLAAKPRCGNGIAESREQCDGTDLRGRSCETEGFASGTLTCATTCTLDTSACTNEPAPACGDGVVNQDTEACDGDDLYGLTCADLDYDGGTLSCDASCQFDERGCTVDPPASAECGNGVLDGAFEECDGLDDAACPGACSAHCACPAAPASGLLEVHVVDVGQGDGLVVVSPDGFVMIVDAGTHTQAATLEAYLSSIGINGVDYTLVSHLHADHLGGMDGVLTAHPEIVASFDNGRVGTSGQYLEYEAAVGTRRATLRTGDFIDLGPSMVAEVLHADRGASNENNNSVVLRLVFGDVAILLGGDCESGCESGFDPGPIDIYKVHHHGSSTSTSESLLALMQPQTAIISVGANNSYGHPAAQTLDRLDAWGVDVWRTDLDGDVEILAISSSYAVNGIGQCLDGQTRPCGTTDVGACALGVETCEGGAWQPCVGAIEPVDEVCGNDVDDDCDGVADADEAVCAITMGPWVRLAQVHYDTAGNDAIEEFIDLYNAGDEVADLAGWRLADNVGTWTLPSGTTLAPGAYLTVARDAAGLYALLGVWPDVSGLTLSLGNTGDVVSLRDAAGVEIDRVAWEGYETGWTLNAATGSSLERVDHAVDTDTPGDWFTRSPAFPLGGWL